MRLARPAGAEVAQGMLGEHQIEFVPNRQGHGSRHKSLVRLLIQKLGGGRLI